MLPPKIRIILLLGLLAASAHAYGGRLDSRQPINLEADRVSIDDTHKISTFSGNVKLSQGTMEINGDQIVVIQDKRGFRHGTVTGNPAEFHQNQEGSENYVAGQGERIEYDSESGIMDIYGEAHVQRGQDDMHGDHITYNSRTGVFQASGGNQVSAHGRRHRVRVVIQPHETAASAPANAEPLSIKPDTSLIQPGKQP
jgi:lipopolysaccharide export system protein LptA